MCAPVTAAAMAMDSERAKDLEDVGAETEAARAVGANALRVVIFELRFAPAIGVGWIEEG